MRYKNKLALDGFSRTFGYGCYRLNGPNGAGKTTIMQSVAGIVPLDQGHIKVGNIDLEQNPMKAKRLISYMPDKPMVYPFMTGKELLNIVAQSKKVKLDKQIKGYIDDLGIEQYLNTKFETMSFGTQRKFTLISALIGAPLVMLMDEPLNGLDQCSLEFLLSYLEIKRSECTILFSDHTGTIGSHIPIDQVNINNCT
ncbi:MAG: ABC transporter ATP-binding protein [Pseudomonadales bacterium]|nr:ABC transporter ATP-binding protein [Pseudomonadales bacterium]